MRYLK